MDDFAPLLVFAVAWIAIHRGIAGSSLRTRLVSKIGENGFRGFFALLSAVTLGGLIWTYSRAPFYPLWFAPRPIYYVPVIVVPVAFVLLAGAFTVPNPTAVAAERVLAKEAAARGALRITRHPFLWAVILWGTAHLLINGDVAAILLFGSLTVTAIIGTFDIDRKRARSNPEQWEKYRRVTSLVPFAAILQRRNKLSVRELLIPLAVGIVLTGVALHFHGRWFGASPLP